jgi:hypothetical protein
MTMRYQTRRIILSPLVAVVTLALAICAVSLGLIPPARAQTSSPVFTGIIPGTAAGGHDVVAYHRAGQPVEGSTAFVHDWNGARWRFASAANRDVFVARPEDFAPAYGGHCSWAASQGYKAKGDPRNWRIVDGRLFLNYDASIQAKWEKDIPGFIAAADRNWTQISAR